MATGNMHKKFGEVRLCDLYVSRQTNTHTHHSTFAPLPGQSYKHLQYSYSSARS